MIVITGAAGFIGSALAWEFNRHGMKDLILVDDFKTSEKWKNYVGLSFQECYGKHEFLDYLLSDDITSITAIYHLGACSSTTEQDGSYLMDNNYRYSQSLAQYALSKEIPFIYASSAATYGNGDEGFLDNDSTLSALRPINRYGYSKHVFDLWLKQEGVLGEVCGLKFFNVFGPNEYHKGDMKSLVCKSYRPILETGKVKLFKSHRPDYQHGEQVRDFVYVKDVVKILRWLLDNPHAKGIFNVGSGKAHSWNDLVGCIGNTLGKRLDIEYFDMPESIRNQYQYFTEAPVQRLRDAGYYERFYSLQEAIDDYVNGYLLPGEKTLAL